MGMVWRRGYNNQFLPQIKRKLSSEQVISLHDCHLSASWWILWGIHCGIGWGNWGNHWGTQWFTWAVLPVARRSQLPTPNRMTVWIDINKCKGKQASLYKKTCINFYSLGCGGCVFDFSSGFKLYTLGWRTFFRYTCKVTFHWTLKKWHIVVDKYIAVNKWLIF